MNNRVKIYSAVCCHFESARFCYESVFTWNVNECVLWETFPEHTSQMDRRFKSWSVTVVHKPNHLEVPSTFHAIRSWLVKFLHEFTEILQGKILIGVQSPDIKFIEALESALNLPILLCLESMEERYKETKFKNNLDKWMREEQGWIIYDDSEGIRDNLERASKFACYALVNKLVFHETLLKRYGSKMEKLSVPDHMDTGEGLRLHLEQYFEEAKTTTGDYETVFGEDHTGIGNRIPFYSDKAVPHWRELINQIHQFDFSKLDFEVIGSIFERLISPEERHKYGQFYTRVEVVDLINSFCIHHGNEKVMDPACGGGTFLVRAYVRKRELDPSRKHGDLLNDLYGVDISHFATHLTTINLATRDLVDYENYPLITRKNFFDIETHQTFLSLPKHIKTKGLGKSQHRQVEIPLLDAVVGNPPYVRQEDIPKSKKGNGFPQPGTKEYYLKQVKEENGVNLSGRSDIHCYFWPHASSFLKENGYLCFLTSSQWLDVEYGFRLQEWILKYFEIIAILESEVEPWFIGARVVTAVTILRRQDNATARMNHTVRFIQLRQPLGHILAHDGTTAGMVEAVDAFRDEILSLQSNTVKDEYRARLIQQSNLWNQGVELGRMMGKGQYLNNEEIEENNGGYYGGKWGIYLRAPDLWFELINRFSSRLAPLGEIAEVKRGITSGKDDFFFPKDVSKDCLQQYTNDEMFFENYGVSRKEVKSSKVKLVLCGKGRGEIRPIESKYLEPEVHSLMEIDGFTVSPLDCARLILLVGLMKKELSDPYIKKYIQWGEQKKYHEGSTCESRITEEKEWYNLTGHEKGSLFWPKSQQYKHVIPINDYNLQCNCNLYDIYLQSISQDLMAGILNSTFIVLSKFQYGRPVGVEGNLKTEIIDVNMMLVPDPRKSSKKQIERVIKAFEKMKQRKALQFLSERRMREMAYKNAGKEEELEKLSNQCELDMPDRCELDDAVLELMGESSKKRRSEILDQLYQYLREYFERTRQKEELAIINKNMAKRRGQLSPKDIAQQIYQEIADKELQWLIQYDPDFIDRKKPFDTFEFPSEGVAQKYEDMLSAHGVHFVKGKKVVKVVESKIPDQDSLIVLLANSGVRGLVRIPHEKEECKRIQDNFETFLHHRQQKLLEMIEQRTNDEDLQKKILDTLLSMLQQNR